MRISTAGADCKSASLELREKIALSPADTLRLSREVAMEDGVSGCVAVSTCNRTEIYISSREPISAAELMRKYVGNAAELGKGIYEYGDFDAALHLAEVACGLRSAIPCEEQICAQLREAAKLSRENGCSDAALNTLFRCAVTAGKRALTEFRVSPVPLSAARAAADTAEEYFGTLHGKRALIIGNGKMGLLAAEALLEKGCGVTMTLRRYKHGENVVPDGARAVDYSDRMAECAENDLVITATRSPHYTIRLDELEALPCRPELIFDLAVPRDAEPGAERYARLFTVDDLCGSARLDGAAEMGIKRIAREEAEEFIRWNSYGK